MQTETNRRNALIVQDVAEDSHRLAEILENHGVGSEIAATPLDFIVRALSGDFEYHLFDLYMGGIDGIEVISKLAAYKRDRHFFLTVSGEPEVARAVFAICKANQLDRISAVYLPLTEEKITNAISEMVGSSYRSGSATA